MRAFIEGSRSHVDGWISFYWGTSIQENEEAGDMRGPIIPQCLRKIRSMSPLAGQKDQ